MDQAMNRDVGAEDDDYDDETPLGLGAYTERKSLPIAYLPESFMTELSDIIRENVKKSAHHKGKVVGIETQDKRYKVIVRSFKELFGMDCKLGSCRNIKQKHITMLSHAWESIRLSPSVIANKLSIMRTFGKWIGKPNLVQESTAYVIDPMSVKRTNYATYDKSWTAQELDVDALIGQIYQHDWRVGTQLKLIQAFGLRKREAVMFKPLKVIDLEFKCITVRDGTKGGRERTQRIRTDRQIAAVELALSKVTTVNQVLSHPDLDLKQSLRRFDYVLEKFGVTKRGLSITVHGLRHQYLNDLYFELTGVHSPVRQMTGGISGMIDKLEHDIARAIISKEAGHSRLSITNAYIGSERAVNKGRPDMASRLQALSNKRTLSTAEKMERRDLIDMLLSFMTEDEIAAGRKEQLGEDVEVHDVVAVEGVKEVEAVEPAAQVKSDVAVVGAVVTAGGKDSEGTEEQIKPGQGIVGPNTGRETNEIWDATGGDDEGDFKLIG